MPETISKFEVWRLNVPSGRPFGDCVCTFNNIYFVAVCLETGRGHVGWGFGDALYGGKWKRPAPYIAPVPSLADLKGRFERDFWPLLRDRNAFELKLRPRAPLAGYSPMHSAIRWALWDLMAQEVELPLYRLLGGDPARNRVRAYGSGLDSPLSDEEAAAIFSGFVRRGFTAVKVKVGNPAVEDDLRRLEVVRKAVGPGVEMAVDANEAWTWEEAVRRIRTFQDAGFPLQYVEDPLLSTDREGYRRLAEAVDVDIAGHDYLTEPLQIRRFLELGVFDRVRVGIDIDHALACGDLGAEFQVPLIFTNSPFELQVHAAVALPGVERYEFADLGWNVLPQTPVRFENGFAIAPNTPGHGLGPKPEVLREFSEPEPADTKPSPEPAASR